MAEIENLLEWMSSEGYKPNKSGGWVRKQDCDVYERNHLYYTSKQLVELYNKTNVRRKRNNTATS